MTGLVAPVTLRLMDQERRHNRLAVVLAAAALIVSVGATGAPALAKIVFADNSDKVDGKHAVGANASAASRAGKLVATRASDGRLPGGIIKNAPNANHLGGRKPGDYLLLDAPAGRLVAEGRVGSNGSLLAAAGAGVTSSQSGTGQYNVTVPGLNPGCTNPSDNALATPFGQNEVSVTVITTQCGSGDVTFSMNTRNSAGTSADGNFFFAIFKGGPVSSSPSSRTGHGNASVCVVRASGERCH
jgi:hypothetical protein